MDDSSLGPVGLRPLAGGFSGETFLGEATGERTVVRIYAGRSAARGPLAPEVDAAVLDLARGILPVPAVLEVRRGDPAHDLPGLLVTSFLPGVLLEDLLPTLDDDRLRAVGRSLGTVLGRLAHAVQPRPGVYADRSLSVVDLPDGADDLTVWVDAHAEGLRAAGWDAALLDALGAVADDAQALLDGAVPGERRHVLVHGDLNAKNVLVDPDTLEVTGVLDWEFAHAGSPYSDLGNLLRLDRLPAYVEGVLAAYLAWAPPGVPEDVVLRARAADLFAVVELAAREQATTVVECARALLEAVARTGDPGADIEWTP